MHNGHGTETHANYLTEVVRGTATNNAPGNAMLHGEQETGKRVVRGASFLCSFPLFAIYTAGVCFLSPRPRCSPILKTVTMI